MQALQGEVIRRPSFILVGAPKCGTTFLLGALRQNPGIFIPPTNELYFHSGIQAHHGPYDDTLERKITRNLEGYLAHFIGAQPGQVIGEFATDYLYHAKSSIPSIKEVCGENTKIIIVLRNPVDRAISQFKHMVSKGHEHLSFAEAVKAEGDRLREGWRWAYQYTGVSMYAGAIKRYMEAFKDVKVMLFEDIVADRMQALAKIERFIGVEGWPYSNTEKRKNVKCVYPNKLLSRVAEQLMRLEGHIGGWGSVLFEKIFALDLKISSDDRRWLMARFREDIENVESLLDRELDAWKRT